MDALGFGLVLGLAPRLAVFTPDPDIWKECVVAVLGLTCGLIDAVLVVLILIDGDPVGLVLSTMLPVDSALRLGCALGVSWTL